MKLYTKILIGPVAGAILGLGANLLGLDWLTTACDWPQQRRIARI